MIHVTVKYSDDMNGGWSYGVINSMAVDEQDAIALTYVVAFCTYLGIIRKLSDTVVQLIQIPVSPDCTPSLQGISPYIDEIPFGKRVFVDFSHQEADFT